MSFNMPLTQELIGSALGLTTVHVNRTLRSLREDKLILIDGKRVTILDFEALSLVSDFDNSYLGETARTLRREMTSSKQGKDTHPPHRPSRYQRQHIEARRNRHCARRSGQSVTLILPLVLPRT